MPRRWRAATARTERAKKAKADARRPERGVTRRNKRAARSSPISSATYTKAQTSQVAPDTLSSTHRATSDAPHYIHMGVWGGVKLAHESPLTRQSIRPSPRSVEGRASTNILVAAL